VRAVQRVAEVEDGLIVRVSCSEACTVSAQLLAPRSLARKLRLRGTTVVGRGSAQVEAAAATYAFVRFDKRVRARLFKQRRARLTLRVAATDPAGNTRRMSEAITLRR
jgi:hypothetical protein